MGARDIGNGAHAIRGLTISYCSVYDMASESVYSRRGTEGGESGEQMAQRRDLAVVLERPAPARSGDPRADILDALVRTIALRGYDRTTIERVLAAADVPAPVFDEHFENKQDCSAGGARRFDRLDRARDLGAHREHHVLV